MRLLARGLLSVMVGLTNLTCSVNILENFADKNTNMAYFYEAQMMINDGNYDGAIEKLNLITGEFASDRKVVGLKASAHGGLCGINFLNFVEAMANMGSARIFEFLLGAFVGATSARIDNCVIAQNLMVSIGAVADRTNDENMFLLVVALAKIGNILNYYADADANATLDGSYLPANVCTQGTPARAVGGDINNADAIELGTGLALAIEQLTALSGVVDLGGASLTTISNNCALLPVNFCAMTTTADWTDGATDAEERAGIRTLINENASVGIGTCVGNAGVCACPP